MRVEVLSDYGGQQIQQTELRLQDAAANTAAWETWHRQAQVDLQAARRDKPLWKRMIAMSTPAERNALAHVQGAWQEVRRADFETQRLYGRRQQQAAGAWGENALVWALSGLPHDWVMLRGYRNKRGETDHVLVGPTGLWAVEVKFRRVRLNVAGDYWWYEKLDSRGNVVGTGPAVDNGGRSWARQVNDVARDLMWWLARNGYQVPVNTAVMLMHERALIGRCEQVNVSLLANRPEYLLNELVQRPPTLSPDSREEIVRLIRRDHQYHAKRRR